MHPALRRTSRPILAAALVLLPSCVDSKTVYVSDGEPLRLAEPVKARVWIDSDGDGVWEQTRNRVPLQEGWYFTPTIEADPADFPPGQVPAWVKPTTQPTDQ